MLIRMISVGLMIMALGLPVKAQQPQKEIVFVVQFTAGGSTDRMIRMIDSHVDKTQYRTRIEYKIGAGGGVGHSYVAGLKNPGETAIMVAANSLVTLPVMNPETNAYDPVNDFVILGHLGLAPGLVVVNSKSGIKTWKEFVEYTRNRPVSYGSAGIGTGGHIVSALIANNQPNFVHVPYKGPAITDLIGGQLTFVTDSVGLVDAHIKSGKLTAIAASNPVRLKDYQNVPTLRELKVNDYGFYRWHLLVSNRGADAETLRYLKNLIAQPAVQRDLATLEMEPVKDFDSDKFMKEEKRRFDAISKHLNLLAK